MKKFSDYFLNFCVLWKKVVFQPKEFFKNIHVIGYGPPFYFFMTCCAVSWFLGCLIFPRGGIAGILASAFSSLLMIVIFFFIAGLQRVVAKFLGSQEDMEHCFWIVAFSGAPAILFFIPVLGWILSLYGIVLMFHGVRIVCHLSDVKTMVVVLAPMVLLLPFALFILMLMKIH